jgi:hypothetical protein
MLPDSKGKPKMRMIIEKHESVTKEPSGRYLTHFVPEPPIHPEKPAFKVAQALHETLIQYNSTESLMILSGDSTNQNTGWKGGTHAHLEKLLNRRLFWAICNLHTNELPLRHLITAIDGPTSSDKGFMGPVCSLLSKVNDMPFSPNFERLSGGEEIIHLPKEVLNKMRTDQTTCYKLVMGVKAGYLPTSLQDLQCGLLCHARWLTTCYQLVMGVKAGCLPTSLQDLQCGSLCHARWLITAQRLVFMWTRKHMLSGQNLKVLRNLVKFCLEYYFKLYFDIKVKHDIVDAPYHILTSLRILKTQPKKVQEAVTFYVKTGAWYSHPECVILSLLASPKVSDRQFAVKQILKLRGVQEYGDNSVRPRKTSKLNISTTSLTTLITWKEVDV